MAAPSSGRIEIFATNPVSQDVHGVLAGSGYDVVVCATPDPRRAPAQLHVVDADTDRALAQCQRLRVDAAEGYAPILVVGSTLAQCRAGLEQGADAALARPFDPAVLLAQVRTLLRVKERHDRLASQAAEAQNVSKRLQAAHAQMAQEMDLARRLQMSFLPQALPHLPGARFAVKYKPFGQVGGDFYDVFRLDEKHLGFYVADAMGHGVPASLLTIFVKKGVRAKEISGQSYRLIPPAEVLYKLNRDLIEQRIPDLPFVTMTYVLFNCEDGALRFARAGHPHPLLLPREGPPTLWQVDGSLLGVFETKYLMQSHQLKPGDKLLLYTDGMDAASFEQQPVGLASLLAAAERFRALPIDEWVERLATDLFTQTQPSDDLTLFGVERT